MRFLVSTAIDFWHVLGEMAPYLLFGFLMAGVLSVLVSQRLIERHFGGRGFWPVVKAAMFGVPLPLCSCGVIPVAASLRRQGASRGATTAFLISTPQTGVDSILVTYSLLGGVFAAFRPLAALVNGIIGGVMVMIFGPPEVPDDHPSSARISTCCQGQERHGVVYRALHYGFVALARDISKSLAVGLILAGVISGVVPDDYFAGLLGGGIGSMLVMMLLGIPMYVCATASVPIAAALIAKGVSPGAALVFLMTGPATNGATIATIWKVMGRRVAIIYLISIALTALASGALLDHLFAVSGVPVGVHVHGRGLGWVQTISAIGLLAVLAAALVPSTASAVENSPAGSEKQAVGLAIRGMTCDHCVQSVRRALQECPGVELADVRLRPGRAVVRGNGFDVETLLNAIRGLNYEAEPEAGSVESSSI